MFIIVLEVPKNVLVLFYFIQLIDDRPYRLGSECRR